MSSSGLYQGLDDVPAGTGFGRYGQTPIDTPTGNPVAPPADAGVSFDWRTHADRLMDHPEMRLERYTSQMEADRLAREASLKLVQDQDQLPAILSYQKQVEDHNQMMRGRLDEFQKSLLQPLPQMRTPRTSLAGNLAGLAAVLAGNRAGDVNAGLMANAQQQERLRYGNEMQAEQAKRQVLEAGMQQASGELARGEAEAARVHEQAVTQWNVQMQRKVQADEFEREQARLTKNDERLAAAQKEHEANDYATWVKARYDVFAKDAALVGGTEDPVTGKSWDAYVDELNAGLKQRGMPLLPYFPQGKTWQAAKAKSDEEFKQKNLNIAWQKLKDSETNATKNLREKYAALAQQKSEFADKMALARYNAVQLGDYRSSMLIAKEAANSEAALTFKKYQKAVDEAAKTSSNRKGLEAKLAGDKTLTRQRRASLQAQLDKLTAKEVEDNQAVADLKTLLDHDTHTADQIAAGARDVGLGENDRLGETQPGGPAAADPAASFASDLAVAQRYLQQVQDPAKQAAIKAAFKRRHGVDLP